jgi:exodeoxyribonuclease VII large subunit
MEPMEDHTYSVSEITRLLKKSIEGNPEFTSVWVKGELSNVTYHSSGHIYFTLKDEQAVLSSAFFKYANKSLSFRLEEGMSVLTLGSFTVYEKRGNYQFIVTQMRLEGIGELLKRIEQLKKRLLEEGALDAARKKEKPFLPRRIGVVTSPTGAAIRDIIKVAMRRFPNIEIVLAPARVQGTDAVASIVRGIEELGRPVHSIDLIICGRGGGSFEDLMPFNEEPVVRAILASRVPVISAVGHQIDHPLSDDAADYSAPTPSAAAEIAVPVKSELVEEIDYLFIRAQTALAARMTRVAERLSGIAALRCFRNPREIVAMRELELVDLEQRISGTLKDRVAAGRQGLLALPDLYRLWRSEARERRSRLDVAWGAVEKLSPRGVLARGYSLATDERGRIIKSIRTVSPGGSIGVMVADGSMGCTVNTIQREVHGGKENAGEGEAKL